MNADPATGRLIVHELGITLSPALTRAQFLRSPVAAASSPGAPPERSFRCQLPVVPQPDTDLYVVLYFDRERLASIHLSHGAPRFGASWADWTEEREMARKAFHDWWLPSVLGLRCGHYRWGEVNSAYDARSGISSIVIAYHVPNAWQKAGRTAGRLWGSVTSSR